MERRRTHTNTWIFADQQTPFSEQVYRIGEAYRKRYMAMDLGRHRHSHPMQLLRLFYFLYLTGSRLMEPVLKPNPQIEIKSAPNPQTHKLETWTEITKVNEKHFSKSVPLEEGERRPGKRMKKNLELSVRDVYTQIFPIYDEWEQFMWNIVTEGGQLSRAEDIFDFQNWKSVKKENLNCLIKTNFRTSLRDDEGKIHRDEGITPHILRHMRMSHMIILKGEEAARVAATMGLDSTRTVFIYADIRKHYTRLNQLAALRRNGLLTSLTVDMAKNIPQTY